MREKQTLGFTPVMPRVTSVTSANARSDLSPGSSLAGNRNALTFTGILRCLRDAVALAGCLFVVEDDARFVPVKVEFVKYALTTGHIRSSDDRRLLRGDHVIAIVLYRSDKILMMLFGLLFLPTTLGYVRLHGFQILLRFKVSSCMLPA